MISVLPRDVDARHYAVFRAGDVISATVNAVRAAASSQEQSLPPQWGARGYSRPTGAALLIIYSPPAVSAPQSVGEPCP